MKKKIKANFKIIIAIVITAIICVSTTVYASYNYFAKDIGFTPKNENWQVDNLEDAVNDLYERKNIESGEAFLLTAGFSGINGVHGYGMYGTDIYIKDLDFKNIKNFNYTYSSSTNDTTWQILDLSNDEITFIKEKAPTTKTVEINEAKKITFRLFVPLVNEATFKVNYYTTIDGIVHTFN